MVFLILLVLVLVGTPLSLQCTPRDSMEAMAEELNKTVAISLAYVEKYHETIWKCHTSQITQDLAMAVVMDLYEKLPYTDLMNMRDCMEHITRLDPACGLYHPSEEPRCATVQNLVMNQIKNHRALSGMLQIYPKGCLHDFNYTQWMKITPKVARD